ncbi:MAG: flagellar hook-basal body protein [Candidatus Eremiobacteraeota bacterium]|nr:flagellar hook-basal body protein [Candidatus Eremiobacteraeota bacterium]
MNRPLSVGAAGMATQSAVLDSIAANLANVDVPGYRVSRTEFAAFISPDGRVVAPQNGGEHRLFTQGRLDATNNPNDLAIDGEGFFIVLPSGGGRAYTRAGNFTPDGAGGLRLPNGAELEGVRLPRGSVSFSVDDHGKVLAQVAGRKGDVGVGRISLATFANPSALDLRADGLFYRTRDAGQTLTAPAGAPYGAIKQRYLERANVTVVAAMMALLAAQRAYEANAKVVQAADEMLRLANNLERG